MLPAMTIAFATGRLGARSVIEPRRLEIGARPRAACGGLHRFAGAWRWLGASLRRCLSTCTDVVQQCSIQCLGSAIGWRPTRSRSGRRRRAAL